MKYPFNFSVKIDADGEGVEIFYGQGFCNSYADAASQLEDYYGPELISIERLVLLEETNRSFIVLPKKICDIYETEIYPEGKFKEELNNENKS